VLLSLRCLQITALKNLGLNIRKAALKPGSKASTLFVTDATTSEKILKSSRLEEIRMCIINNMLYFHPVSAVTYTVHKVLLLAQQLGFWQQGHGIATVLPRFLRL
jgi:hypothetical protein